ncbi:hypothetical protein O9992_30335 [Vibrio lentus]|nr:hypothetical protein [Vibrio lentus]
MQPNSRSVNCVPIESKEEEQNAFAQECIQLAALLATSPHWSLRVAYGYSMATQPVVWQRVPFAFG